MGTAVVLGGGISGLSAAYYLTKTAIRPFNKIILLEASPRLGGWIDSTVFSDGAVYEHGPRSVRGAGEVGINTLHLVESLGLADELVAITKDHVATKNRFIYVDNKLHVLPNGLLSLFKKQSPFSSSIFSQVWKEPFRKASKLEDDTIHNFISRRLGAELADYAFDPMVRGIYAGNSQLLSVKSCFPSLFNAEQNYGSITKGMLKAPKASKSETESPLVKKYKEEKWTIWSCKQGLQQVVDRMQEILTTQSDVEILTETPCSSIEFKDMKAKVKHSAGEVEASHVFSAVASQKLGKMIRGAHEPLVKSLCSIPFVSVGVVNLEYEGQLLPVQGFGHLVPSCVESRVMGIIYESCLFPEHGRKGEVTTKVSCMMGGAWFPELYGDPDQVSLAELENDAMQAVRKQLGIKSLPIRTCVRIQKECIPQYLVGHTDLLETMDTYIQDKSLPLSLIGSSYRGPSINDCIYNTKLEVESVLNKSAN